MHARTRATLDTAGLTFAGFLVGVIVIVGGLIYFPMLILGPIGNASPASSPVPGRQWPGPPSAEGGPGRHQETGPW